MKKLTTLLATFALLACASSAEAGIFYGNGLANRISSGPLGGMFRAVGNMERQKDIWIFGRPIGESRAYSSQPRYYPNSNGNYYRQNGTWYYYSSPRGSR